MKIFFEEGKHRLQDLGVHGSGRVVIEINHAVILSTKTARSIQDFFTFRGGGLASLLDHSFSHAVAHLEVA